MRVVPQPHTSSLHACTKPGRGQLKCYGTRTETKFRLSAKWASPFKSAGASVQSITDSRGLRISGSNTPCFEVMIRVLDIHYIRQFPLHFPVRASPFAITFQLESTPFALDSYENGTIWMTFWRRGYDDYWLLGYKAVKSDWKITYFRKNLLFPSSWY
jgi:hypothetical protein